MCVTIRIEHMFRSAQRWVCLYICAKNGIMRKEKILDYLSEIIKAAVWGDNPPEEPKWNKWIHRNLSENHCPDCLKLNECWFEKEKTPKWPHHLFCHCVLEDVPYNDVLSESTATASYSKFNPYLFDPDNQYSHNKQVMFEKWGYSIADSKWMQKEMEKQGLEKYISGDYTLGRLNEQGQRINIRIEIPNRTFGGTVSFISGWMVRSNGQITLNTPYGGK